MARLPELRRCAGPIVAGRKWFQKRRYSEKQMKISSRFKLPDRWIQAANESNCLLFRRQPADDLVRDAVAWSYRVGAGPFGRTNLLESQYDGCARYPHRIGKRCCIPQLGHWIHIIMFCTDESVPLSVFTPVSIARPVCGQVKLSARIIVSPSHCRPGRKASNI
jgi:hypothetical protein